MREKLNENQFLKKISDLLSELSTDSSQLNILRINEEVYDTQLFLFSNPEKEIWLGIFHARSSVRLQSIPSINGLRLENGLLEGRQGTLVLCSDNYDAAIYYKFLRYLINELGGLTDAKETVVKLYSLLLAWKDFFTGSNEPLTPEAQIGLMGELVVLQDLVIPAIGAHLALESWHGPVRGLHDFVLPVAHLEVKTTLADLGRKFYISGENQLENIPDKYLYLVNPVFEASENGLILCDYIASVKRTIGNNVSSLRLYENLVGKAGYHAIDEDYYSETGVRVTYLKRNTYLVDENFPRLTPGMCGGSINVSKYSIDAEGCEGSRFEGKIQLGEQK